MSMTTSASFEETRRLGVESTGIEIIEVLVDVALRRALVADVAVSTDLLAARFARDIATGLRMHALFVDGGVRVDVFGNGHWANLLLRSGTKIAVGTRSTWADRSSGSSVFVVRYRAGLAIGMDLGIDPSLYARLVRRHSGLGVSTQIGVAHLRIGVPTHFGVRFRSIRPHRGPGSRVSFVGHRPALAFRMRLGLDSGRRALLVGMHSGSHFLGHRRATDLLLCLRSDVRIRRAMHSRLIRRHSGLGISTHRRVAHLRIGVRFRPCMSLDAFLAVGRHSGIGPRLDVGRTDLAFGSGFHASFGLAAFFAAEATPGGRHAA